MLTAGVLTALLLCQAADPVTLEDELRRARNEYAYGNYDAAADKLHALLYPMRLTADAQVIEARKYLALSYTLLNKPDAANQEFAKLLYLDPDYQLDAFSVAPAVIESFERMRRSLKAELDTIRQRRNVAKAPPPEAPRPLRVITTRVIERSDIVTLMPFGIGQFYNDDTLLGVVFCASEIVLLGVNIGAYLWGLNLSGYTDDQKPLVQGLAIAQYASLALFGTTWSIGALQARSHFIDTVEAPPTVTDDSAQSRRWTPGMALSWRF